MMSKRTGRYHLGFERPEKVKPKSQKHKSKKKKKKDGKRGREREWNGGEEISIQKKEEGKKTGIYALESPSGRTKTSRGPLVQPGKGTSYKAGPPLFDIHHHLQCLWPYLPIHLKASSTPDASQRPPLSARVSFHLHFRLMATLLAGQASHQMSIFHSLTTSCTCVQWKICLQTHHLQSGWLSNSFPARASGGQKGWGSWPPWDNSIGSQVCQFSLT